MVVATNRRGNWPLPVADLKKNAISKYRFFVGIPVKEYPSFSLFYFIPDVAKTKLQGLFCPLISPEENMEPGAESVAKVATNIGKPKRTLLKRFRVAALGHEVDPFGSKV